MEATMRGVLGKTLTYLYLLIWLNNIDTEVICCITSLLYHVLFWDVFILISRDQTLWKYSIRQMVHLANFVSIYQDIKSH